MPWPADDGRPGASCYCGLSNLPSPADRLPGLVSRWVFSDELRTQFAVAKYGDASGVRGAAWLGAAG